MHKVFDKYLPVKYNDDMFHRIFSSDNAYYLLTAASGVGGMNEREIGELTCLALNNYDDLVNACEAMWTILNQSVTLSTDNEEVVKNYKALLDKIETLLKTCKPEEVKPKFKVGDIVADSKSTDIRLITKIGKWSGNISTIRISGEISLTPWPWSKSMAEARFTVIGSNLEDESDYVPIGAVGEVWKTSMYQYIITKDNGDGTVSISKTSFPNSPVNTKYSINDFFNSSNVWKFVKYNPPETELKKKTSKGGDCSVGEVWKLFGHKYKIMLDNGNGTVNLWNLDTDQQAAEFYTKDSLKKNGILVVGDPNKIIGPDKPAPLVPHDPRIKVGAILKWKGGDLNKVVKVTPTNFSTYIMYGGVDDPSAPSYTYSLLNGVDTFEFISEGE